MHNVQFPCEISLAKKNYLPILRKIRNKIERQQRENLFFSCKMYLLAKKIN